MDANRSFAVERHMGQKRKSLSAQGVFNALRGGVLSVRIGSHA